MIYILWLVFVFANPRVEELLVQPTPESVSWNEDLTVVPILGHQFNLKSPNRCGNGKLVSASEEVVSCKMSSPGAQELEVFVCDSAKTFCKREMIKISVKWPQSPSEWWQLLKSYFFQ